MLPMSSTANVYTSDKASVTLLILINLYIFIDPDKVILGV